MIYFDIKRSGKYMSYTDLNMPGKVILLTKTVLKNKYTELVTFIKYLTMYKPSKYSPSAFYSPAIHVVYPVYEQELAE